MQILGHTIVPGTIAPGTLLYHGRTRAASAPSGPEWVSFDPEHSYMFGRVMHTYVVGDKPLKVLYFDGSSPKPRCFTFGVECRSSHINSYCTAQPRYELEFLIRKKFFYMEISRRTVGKTRLTEFPTFAVGGRISEFRDSFGLSICLLGSLKFLKG